MATTDDGTASWKEIGLIGLLLLMMGFAVFHHGEKSVITGHEPVQLDQKALSAICQEQVGCEATGDQSDGFPQVRRIRASAEAEFTRLDRRFASHPAYDMPWWAVALCFTALIVISAPMFAPLFIGGRKK
jgi:hypothetical protein